jgi:hypothetical protein
MKTITKSLIVVGVVAVTGLATAPAQALFVQPFIPAPHFPIRHRQHPVDLVTPLIESTLDFVSDFTFLPAPINPYFYNYNRSPFSSYGSGYGSGYGYGSGLDLYGNLGGNLGFNYGFGGYGY